ncbi:(2Fe-2S)-binding protein [Streptomyces sp. NPDC051569]|uniref:(2Fe-2S)-binding protein n=1 Tax=Streptomyces sp. NPDC051569 TaxID=3365661 RepID=UPI0037B35B58
MTTEDHSGQGPDFGSGPDSGADYAAEYGAEYGAGYGYGSGAAHGQGGWQPVPQGGEYDGESTAFVQLPPEDTEDAPLAAPGHGYVPPMIVPLTPADPAAGSWVAQQQEAAGGVRWPEPRQDDGQYGGQYGEYAEYGARERAPYGHGGYDPQLTGQWAFGDMTGDGGGSAGPAAQTAEAGQTAATPPAAPAAPTGEWSIPVAQGDLPDESGEFSTSVPASPWGGGTPPATLPGGAAAPWATPPEPVSVESVAEVAEEEEPEAVAPEADLAPEPEPEPEHESAAGSEPAPEPEAAADADADAGPDAEADAGPEAVAETEVELVPEPEPEPEPASEPEPEPQPLTSSTDSAEHPSGSYVLRVNGADRPVTDAWIGESLLYVLRERLGLAGAKDGCSQGECGACNVQVDGRLVASCLVPAATAAGSEVRTVEGLAADGEPSDVQRALAKCGAVQCGFCIPGMAMTVHDLLEGNHAPTELETRQALCGNLCRCSGYRGVLDAVSEVVSERAASAEAAAAASEEARNSHQAPPGTGSTQPSHPHSHDGGMA